MKKKQCIHLIALTLGIAVADVILFSEALVGLSFTGGNILETALAFTAAAMNLIVGGVGYYSILFKPAAPKRLYKKNDLAESKDYITALNKQREKEIFESYINRGIEQVNRFQDKSEALTTLLLQSFTPEEMSFKHFNNVVGSIKQLFFGNLKKAINRMIIFDNDDFNKTSNILLSDNIRDLSDRQRMQTKVDMYNEHIAFVDNMLDNNDDILVKMDKLLLELSKLDGLEDYEDFNNLAAVQEINSLISQVKYYRQ